MHRRSDSHRMGSDMNEDFSGFAGDRAPFSERLDDGAELRFYLSILRRRFWIILAAFVIITTLAALYAFKSTPIYQGEARLLIEKDAPRFMNFNQVAAASVADADYYNTQVELAGSRTVLEKAASDPAVSNHLKPDSQEQGNDTAVVAPLLAEIRRTVSAIIGLDPPEPVQPPRPWEILKEKVTAERVEGTHLLRITAESPHPDRAAGYANAVGRAFREHHFARRKDLSSEAFQFLQRQKKKQEEKLARAESELQQFRRKARLVSFPSDKGEQNPVKKRLEELNDKLTETQLQRIELEAEVTLLSRQMRSAQESGLPAGRLLSLPQIRADTGIRNIRSNLIAAREKVSSLEQTYGPGHPQFKAASARAEFLESQMSQSLDQLIKSLENRLQILRDEEGKLHDEYEAQKKTALSQSEQDVEYTRLKNKVERNRKLFDVLVERMREVDLTTDSPKTQVQIAETADVPQEPVSPKKLRITVLGAFMSLMVGGGLAFLLEYLDDTIKTPEDLEDGVGLPVLGFVPRMLDRTGDTFEHRSVISLLQPASSASEAFRSVRTSLFFSNAGRQARLLAITSGSAEAGKSTTASNLACVVAQNRRRVVLVDADLRRPTVHRTYELAHGTGLSSVLSGKCTASEAIQSPRLEYPSMEWLDVMPAGGTPPNPAELLDSQAMEDVLSELRGRYDVVIVDTPPVLFAADANIVASKADGTVLVVKSGQNSRSLVERAHQRLTDVDAQVLGAVLNDVQLSSLQSYDSAYSHYGYSRYYRNYQKAYYQRA